MFNIYVYIQILLKLHKGTSLQINLSTIIGQNDDFAGTKLQVAIFLKL